MRKSYIRIAGVTLLEIMLVLAIAAMVIIMSVRYYQSASSSQQATAAFAQIQSITAAADTLAQATGDYSKAGLVTGVPSMIGTDGKLLSPWNTAVTISDAKVNTYTVTIVSMPGPVCSIITAQLGANAAHFATGTTCDATVKDFSYTYTR